ncbi:MAG: hypothetical protein Q4D53_00665 [Leptotrichiaceae bacterium]|nr:hypothetical protein [Leptotrichiaceae bacterium]
MVKTKKVLFVFTQILLFTYYFLVGRFDWDYGFDLPFRLLFGGILSIGTGIVICIGFYSSGTKFKYENDKVLKISLFFIILAVLLLFRIDIIGVIKLCLYNGFFILGIVQKGINIKSRLFKISKIILWFIGMYMLIPSFSILFGIFIGIFGIGIFHYNVLITIFIMNVCFGYIVKKYFNNAEIKLISILVFSSWIITLIIFMIFGFNVHREDYYGIIYTFPYKAVIYLGEGSGQTLQLGNFFHIVSSLCINFTFYIGFFINKIKYKNKV